ncbi:MAG: hypothetical protein Kow0076_6090 [Francisella sp.]
MRKYFLLLISIYFLPLNSSAFYLIGDAIKLPEQKEYIIYSSKQIETKTLPNTDNATINTTLLVYNIQNQASTSTNMFYIKDNSLHSFKNSSWALPLSKMLTIATFEYILENNIVSNLAQNVNVRQDFTLSGTTSYGPILDLDNKHFYFYITFYLKNEKTGFTDIKTIKYQQKIDNDKVDADLYAKMTNKALVNILSQLKPWLIKNLKIQEQKNKDMLESKHFFINK